MTMRRMQCSPGHKDIRTEYSSTAEYISTKNYMKQLSTFLTIIVIALGCKSHPEPFEYTIRGTVIGLDSGEFYLSESPRVGDKITIPFKNHKFEYKGTTPNMFTSSIVFNYDDPGGFYSIIVEPGEFILELYTDSVALKSKVIAGYYNLSFQKAYRKFKEIFTKYDEHEYNSAELKDEIVSWIKDNSKNYAGLSKLYSSEMDEDYVPLDLVGEIINGIDDKNLKKSREYIKLHSIWQSKKDSINMVGKKAMDFELLNVDKEAVSFQSVARNKITFVEKSGSWCGNSTRLSRELIPIYEKYKKKDLKSLRLSLNISSKDGKNGWKRKSFHGLTWLSWKMILQIVG